MNPLNLFDQTVRLLDQTLDLRSSNQRVIAANIANAETPGYAPARFEFEAELKSAIKGTGPSLAITHQRHIPYGAATVEEVRGRIVRDPDQTGIGDENGVSVDEEMIALSENQIMYEASAQLLNKKLGLIKYVVGDGR